MNTVKSLPNFEVVHSVGKLGNIITINFRIINYLEDGTMESVEIPCSRCVCVGSEYLLNFPPTV